MPKNPVLSIIIATLNSEKLLPDVLKSIDKQSFSKNKIEILVLDGGSTDDTKKIASRFGCTVIHNPRTVPVYGKYLGFVHAKGKYVMYLDSDEVIEDIDSIERKMNTFITYPSVHAVTGSGYKNPKGYPFINQYINEFGDPFSFFYYRLSKDVHFFIPTMKQKYKVVAEGKEDIVFNFSEAKELPILELIAVGSIVDKEFLLKHFNKIKNTYELVAHFFYLMVSKEANIAITKNDPLIHYSSNGLKKYLGKITSRVVNNIFTPAKEGFLGRDEFGSKSIPLKKYLFIPYSFSIIFPLFDAIYLSITRKNIGYFVHVFLCIYTAGLILYYLCLKFFGVKPVFKSYGETQLVKKDI